MMVHRELYIEPQLAVEAVGEEGLHQLRRCHEAALDVYRETIPPILPIPGTSLRAAIMNGLVVEQARHRFEDIPGTRICEKRYSRFTVLFSDRVAVTFKKFRHAGSRLTTSNIETGADRAWGGQQLSMFAPALPRLTAGYLMPPHSLTFSGLFLALMDRQGSLWEYDIRTRECSGTLEFPHLSPLSAAEVERRRQQWDPGVEADTA